MIYYYSVLLVTWCIVNINAQQCGVNEFTCNNGRCIPYESWCDLYKTNDCGDQSDEVNCLLTIPYMCNFDAAPCFELRNLADNQNVNWTRVRGPTPSANTGPEAAHSPEFYYLFESSSPVQQGQSVSFITLPLAAVAGTTICVEFYYHMYGASMGSLYVNATSRFDGGTFDQNLVRIVGNQGNIWLKTPPSRFTVVDSQRTRIEFRAVRGSDYTSDIGIDDISITNCEAGILPFVCDFEQATDRYCGMYNGTGNDNMDWNALNTATGSSRTGPDSAESGMWFVYIEATTNSNNPNRNAILYFPAINTRQAYPTRVCLTFYYHMYGTSIKSLEVYTTQTTTRWDVITGEQGNQWLLRRVSLDLLSPTDQIFLVGNIGFDIYGDIAVDNVRIDLGNCIVAPTPTPSPMYRVPYQCSFETPDIWCGITQSANDQFDWTWRQGPTPSDNTGPSSAFDGVYYIYVEVSDARDGDTARIFLPPFDYVGSVCVQFYYHMFGNNIGTLKFYLKSIGPQSPFVSISGNQGNQWLSRQATTALLSRTDQIGIEANRFGGVQGDIALDYIRVIPGECTTVPITLPYNCDFELDACSMQQLSYPEDYFDWTRYQGPTPDQGTGPSAAYQGSWYYYADVSGVNKVNAKSLLPAFNYIGFVCLDFYYHMWGANVGSLKIYTTSTGSNNPLATIVGNQGNQWLRRRETVYLRTKTDQIGFEAVRGNGDFGDIAIDKVQVTQGQCTVTAATLPYFCGFESDFCNMEQKKDDAFDWTRNTGLTDSANTGPDRAYEGSWYMYTEVSDPSNINARILLPSFNYVGPVCLEFYYHMWGAQIGELRVYTTNKGPAFPLIVLIGNKGNQWLKWSESITLNGPTDRIGFQGTRGNGIEGDIAVDNVKVTQGPCQGTVVPLPYRCDFEVDFCSIEQLKDDRFDWTRFSGSTPTANTGPTQAFEGNWYIYTEVSGLLAGDYARILLPRFDYAGAVCMDYAYHMWGATIGRLNIYTTETGVTTPIVTIATDQGNRWIRSRSTIVLNSKNDRIGFEGIAGPGIEGDIALDSIYITRGPCETSPVSGLPFTCGFETGLCGIQQLSDDNFDWTNNTGATPTSSTGPTQAYSGNYYMYTEVSGRRLNDVARMLLPEFNYVGDVCVSFYYHMWGTDIGTLTLFTRTANVDAPIFSLSGDQGNAWRFARRTVFLNNPRTRIGFQGNAGSNIRGDIALDNVMVTQGPCPGSTTPVPTTTPAPPRYINLPFSCDFEQADICGMRQSVNDNLDWIRYAFATQTPNTGPSQAQMGNYYLYIEADQGPYGTAKLEFPPINYLGRACLSYYYYMYGADLGSLDVYTSRYPSLALIQGDRGNMWQLKRINVDLGGINDILGFIGTVGPGVRSDIAIDNINLQTGDCSPVTPSPSGAIPYYCDFDLNTLCNMNQRADDNFDWTLYSGPTLTPGTGPTNAYSGTKYLLAEGRNRRAQEVAMIETPVLNYIGTVCLSFYYHMWGSKVGYLTVFVSSRGVQNVEWTVNENKGNRWVNQQLTINLNQLSDRIVFRAQIGPPDSFPYTDIGLDSIQITQGQCVAGPSPPTQTGLPYYCDFEMGDINACYMIQATADNYDWLIYRDGTPTPGTGPTSAQSGIYYIYMEADGHTKHVAIVLLPQFNYVGEVCLSYYYHMYGQDEGALYVTTNDRTVTAPWRSIFGNQGNQWNFDQVTIDLKDTSYRIGFYGQIGLGIRSDIALDTIRVDQGRCGVATTTPRPFTTTTTPEGQAGNVPFRCGFEYNQVCGMIQRTTDNFDWTPNRGPTDSANTGPDRAYLGDWYLYIESSQPRQPYDKAYIETPALQYSGPICIRFWYYLYGAGIGRLVVFQNSAGESNPFFSLSGNQGQQWVEVSRELQIPYGDKIVFLGELNYNGNRHQGDIAIDEVQISPGTCTGNEPITTTRRPFPPVTGIPLELSDYYSCSMEYTSNAYDACRIRNFNVPNSILRWRKISGRTPSSLNNQNRKINGALYPVTGPERAAQGNFYLYAEASNTRKGDIAGLIMEGSDFRRTGPNCLRFSYLMNGYNMGTLAVYGRSRTDNQLKKLWSISRDQLNEWKKAAIDVDGNDITEITIQAVMTGEFNSDFALDDIRYMAGTCQPLPTTYEWLCDFEISDGSSTLCSMEQAPDGQEDTFDWLLWHGKTPSEETGPDQAYNGEYYIYAEASKPRQPGDRAIIKSPPIRQRTGVMCLEFYYSMNGFHMGTLNVYLNNGININDRRSLTTFTKENWLDGSGWQQARINVNVQYNDRIAFESIVGTEFSSDMAIDNIRLRPQQC